MSLSSVASSVIEDLAGRPGTGDIITVIDPATEEQITEFPDAGPEAVNAAVAAAKASHDSGVWTDIPARKRAQILWRLGDLIDENAKTFAELESLDAGMPPFQTEMIVSTCAEFFRYYAGWCTKLNGTSYQVQMEGGVNSTTADFHAYTTREPYGVVGLIYPWNGPLFNACAKVAPALAAGCSSVVKPAEETPLTAVLLERLIAEAGVPEGVANFVIGYGATAGAAITAHPDVEKVAFTGSTEVGKQIMRTSADSLKKVTLELGGKSPVLIFDDADLDMAIMMASMGIFVHSGQGCVCGSRIFVQRGVYEQVVAGISMIGENLVLGGPKDEGAMISPLVSQKQLDRVLGYIEQGKSDGNEIVSGGYRLDRKGYFIKPTVVTGVDPDTSRLYREEIFGPVVTILPFDDDDEAIAMANDTDYGLAATAWTTNLARAHNLGRRLNAGMVGLNCQLTFDHNVPFGGFKQSGLGKEFGHDGIDAYMKTKTIWAAL